METKDYALIIVSLVIGWFLGYGYMENKHNDLMFEKEVEYQESINRARNQERLWQYKAQEIENEYQKQLSSIKQSNDAIIDRLRSQLDSHSKRLSSCSKSSDRTDGASRSTAVSNEIKNLINFSEQCAKRADSLIIQVNGLQKWYKETSK